MSNIEAAYGFNFHGTPLHPPPMTTSTLIIVSFTLVFHIFGFVFSLMVLYATLHSASSTKQSDKRTNPGQRLQSSWDALLPLSFIISLVPSVLNNRVPSMAFCQFQGFLTQTAATCQFACITGLMLERFNKLKRIRDGLPAKVSSIWLNLKVFCWPVLVVYAALPWITSGEFGAFGMKSNGVTCFATGGLGIVRHDL